MRIFHSSEDYQKTAPAGPVVALGNFDGVHLAHQAMFKLAKKIAKKLKAPSAAYTFHPHPVKVLSPQNAPPLIQTLKQRLHCLQEQGLDAIILEPFTLKLSRLSPQKWFEDYLIKKLKVQAVVAGYDFTFGAKRSGTSETLKELCQTHRVHCEILEAQFFKGTLISSTCIREMVLKGDVGQAQQLMGRPFSLKGKIIPGAGRGKTLGIPTANLACENELIPAKGVYATYLTYQDKTYPAVTNVGLNPTFKGKNLSIETHLIGKKLELYGQKIVLNFIKKLREEKKFANPAALSAQIQRDIQKVKALFKLKI